MEHMEVDNSVRRLLLLKIVLHSLFAHAIDGLRPNLAYADPFWWISGWSICLKRPHFHSRRNNFKSSIYRSSILRFLCCKVRILKNRGIVRHMDVISVNKRWKCPFMTPLQTSLPKKTQTARWNRLQTMSYLLSFHMLNCYGLPVRWR